MPSLIPGYEYDIFISYRHNDNRSGWVTEFVKDLQEELSATIKESVSVYFDSNPHDGLLEAHNVDKSLEGKLRSLIFIPVLSQTYCNEKTFAWQQEFRKFNSLSKADLLGAHIEVSNGNVCNRILPVRIHHLNQSDVKLFEKETGTVLRAIDFIYREPGVNRPLRPNEDHPAKNQNQITYRNQINKLANAVKEILDHITSGGMQTPAPLRHFNESNYSPTASDGKSIIVLPFVNMSNDPGQEYFSDGLTEEIITDLSRLRDVMVISRSSAMTFKGANKKIVSIAGEVGVRYVLEGSVRRSGSNLRITAQLIDAQTDSHLWAEKYTGVLEDIFDMQEKVSRSIVEALEIKLTTTENKHLSGRRIENATALDLYLRAKKELAKWTTTGYDNALKFLENSIEITGPNAVLYIGLAETYWGRANLGVNPVENYSKAREYVEKALELEPELPEAHFVLGGLEMSGEGNLRKCIFHYKAVVDSRINEVEGRVWLGVIYAISGKPEKALENAERIYTIDPLNVMANWVPIISSFYSGNFGQALEALDQALEREPGNLWYIFFVPLIHCCENRNEEALSFINRNIDAEKKDYMSVLSLLLKAAVEKKPHLFDTFLTDDMKGWAERDFQYSHTIAMICSFAGMREDAMGWLEHAVKRNFINYPFLSRHCPSFKLLKDDPRHTALLQTVKKAWEDFD